jgi:hypothetical protein
MLTYAWVPEQSFLYPLPFIFLSILGYRAKRGYMYALVVVQVLIFVFSIFNWGPFIFEPFLKQFSPELLVQIQFFDPAKNSFIWSIREVMGLIVSLALAVFLIALVKPSILKQAQTRIAKTLARLNSKK